MTIRRMKTYTGGQGYVYQYYFVGKRPALAGPSDARSTEYIFDVTSDRKTTFAVSVLVEQEALRSWTKATGARPPKPKNMARQKCACSRPSTKSKTCWRRAGIWWSTRLPWKRPFQPWVSTESRPYPKVLIPCDIHHMHL